MITDLNYWILLAFGVPVFWIIPQGFRLGFLALISFAYVFSLEPIGSIVLLAWSMCFYFFSPLARRSISLNWILPVLVVGILGYLAYFKYLPRILGAFSGEPVLHRVIIPLGISYFTFKLIHYAVEVYRGNIPEHNLQNFLCYIFLAPIFTAGPIERFDHFQKNIQTVWNRELAVEGLTRIAHGLIKKLVIGNIILLSMFGTVNDAATLLERLAALPTYKVWGFCVLSFLYMYLDFSAYSDIAIGTSRLFGIRIMENFNWPILGENIAAFWKRWHMTLSGWCQSYVYMPVIGLTRNPYLSVYMSFSAIGLWHSGSLGWLLWGIYHATGISAYGYWGRFRRRRKWKGFDGPYRKWLGWALTMAFVSAGSVLTALDGVGSSFDMFRVFAKLFFLNIPAG
jgi:alginate O-acetyltransferase complex protein AlgI